MLHIITLYILEPYTIEPVSYSFEMFFFIKTAIYCYIGYTCTYTST